MTDRGDRIERSTPPSWRARWARLSPLGRDLTVVLAIKFAALFLLWWAFVGHPGTQEVTVTAPSVGAHLIPFASPEQSPHAKR